MINFSKETWNSVTQETIQFIKNIPFESLLFRPKIDDAWTIHEQIIHLVDSELNAYLR